MVFRCLDLILPSSGAGPQKGQTDKKEISPGNSHQRTSRTLPVTTAYCHCLLLHNTPAIKEINGEVYAGYQAGNNPPGHI